MDKKDLKKDLADIKAKIKANSTDAHFADTLIAELLSIKGQIDHEPTLVHIPLSDVDDKLEGETFAIYSLKSGDVAYHLKGGYTLIASNRFFSLNDALRGYVANQHIIDTELNADDKELYENDLWASTYLLNLPTIAFSDLEFKYKIVNRIIEYLDELQKKLLVEAELQDETPEENREFEDATMALETLKSEIAKDSKE